MSNKKWEVSVYFEHNENFLGRTTGGVCHIKVKRIKPTAESEETWIDGTDLGRDQVFAFQDVCKKLGLDNIGEGSTKNTRYFETDDPKMVNRALCMTKYAGKFGTSDKNEYEYRWWPADPEESINTRKCWRVSVKFTRKKGDGMCAMTAERESDYITECRQLSIWVQQIRPKLEDRHYVAGGDLSRSEANDYAEMAQKHPMNMIINHQQDFFSMFDSFETDDVDHVNKALLYTYYAGKFGTREKTNYGYSWTG